MDKPWFNLDPNNSKDPWWLYSSITDTETDSMEKNDLDIECYLILQQYNMGYVYYRLSVWFKNDPNRYKYIMYDSEWIFHKKIKDMNEGDIININNLKFKVYNCRFLNPNQIDKCKILERISE